MSRHIYHRNWRIEWSSGGFRSYLFKDFARPRLFHCQRQRVNLGNRLYGEGILHVSEGEDLIVRGNDGDTEKLRIHLRKIRNVISVLSFLIILKLVVGLLNH